MEGFGFGNLEPSGRGRNGRGGGGYHDGHGVDLEGTAYMDEHLQRPTR